VHFVVFKYIFPELVNCSKKNLATLTGHANEQLQKHTTPEGVEPKFAPKTFKKFSKRGEEQRGKKRFDSRQIEQGCQMVHF
jgi:hypothetical protein